MRLPQLPASLLGFAAPRFEAFRLFAKPTLLFFQCLGLRALAVDLDLRFAQVLLEEQRALLQVVDDAVGIGFHEPTHSIEESHGLVLSFRLGLHFLAP